MNLDNILNTFEILFSGIGTTLEIFIISLVLSIPFGILIALGRNSKNKVLSGIMNLYILIIRGTPIMLQIIFVYFAPYYLFKISYDRFLAINLALILNYGAYFAEIFRTGINSIPKGQYEAAFTLGMSKKTTFFRIVLPQVVKRILPAMSNEVISLTKTTSLAQIIGVTEMFALAQKQASFQFSIMPLCIAGVFYLLLCGIITVIFHYFEKRLSYYKIV